MADHHNRRLTPQYLKLLVGMRAKEVRSGLDDIRLKANPNAKHVLIFAQGRSGTTLLESLLVSTGYFKGMGEPLHLYTREVWAPMCYVRGLGRGSLEDNLVVHVKGSQLIRARRRPVDPRTFLRDLHRDGWTIVNVHRRSIADQVLSECLALARGAYHKTDDTAETNLLHIDPEAFMTRYDRRCQFHEEDRTALNGVPHLRVVYETDLKDAASHQDTVDRVLMKLDLPLRSVRTQLRRIGGDDPRNRLENYSEIVAALEARGCGWNTTVDDLFDGLVKQPYA